MTLQANLKLYRINHKLVRMLNESYTRIIFLTARKPHQATVKLLDDVLTRHYGIRSLRTDTPAEDKVQEILNQQEYDTERFCIFDDNKKVRDLAMEYDIDAFDPTPLYEKMVK